MKSCLPCVKASQYRLRELILINSCHTIEKSEEEGYGGQEVEGVKAKGNRVGIERKREVNFIFLLN
jgi:hypothetical protein